MPPLFFLVAAGLINRVTQWWQGAKMWTVMYRGGLVTGALALIAFVIWRVLAARRNRVRLEALVASRTRQLQQSEELFRSIFEHASEGVFQSSLDGRNLRANPAMAHICGYDDPAQMRELLTDVSSQFYVEPQRRAEFRRRIAATGVVNDFESEIRRKDGGTVWISENVRIVTDPATGESVYQGSIIDITARREMREAQEQARRAAEAASQAKSTFLAQVTHELRTPLTGILSGARVALRDPALDDKNRERFTLIADSGEHLLSLIDEVLDLSRIEAGRIDLRPVDFDLDGLLRAVGEDCRLRAAEGSVGFRQQTAPETGRSVHGDPVRLRQVLANLLGNAFKYTDQGEVVLHVQRSGERVRFEISDTGIGIPADQVEAVFEPFHQIALPGRRRASGVGLGLNISARLVERLGGRLELASEVGRGSRFWFEMPLPLAEDATGNLSGTPPAPVPVPAPVLAKVFPLPSPAEIDGLLALSLAGDIVRLRARFQSLRDYPQFTGELERLAAGFQMDAIGAFLHHARAQTAGAAPAIPPP